MGYVKNPDAFLDYFPDYFSDYVGLYAIIFLIIYDYFTASADSTLGKWECADSSGTALAILDPIMEECLGLVSVDEDSECLLICIDWKARRQNGKLPDGAFLYDYTHNFLYYTH